MDLVFLTLTCYICVLHVTACPTGCNCDYNKLHCSYKNLEVFPSIFTIPIQVTWVDVRKNKIGNITLEHKHFNRTFQNVKHLYLDYNLLTELPGHNESILSVFEEIQYLSLSYNKIETIASDVFRGLQQLRELILSNNLINILPGHLFGGLHQLKILHLQENKIKHIAENAFFGLRELQRLDLSTNHLETVGIQWLHTLFSLRKLFLGSNSISKFEPDKFSWPDTLRELDLHNNNITTVPPLPIKDCHDQPIDKCQDRRAKVLLQGNDIYCGCRRPEHDKGLINKLLPAVSVCCFDVQKVCPKAKNGKSKQSYSLRLFKEYLNGPVCEKPNLEINFRENGYNVCVATGEPQPKIKVSKENLIQHRFNKNGRDLASGIVIICEASNAYGTTKEVAYYKDLSCGSSNLTEKINNETSQDKMLIQKKSENYRIPKNSFVFPGWSVIVISLMSFCGLAFMVISVLSFRCMQDHLIPEGDIIV